MDKLEIDKMPYECLGCGFRPGEKEFDPKWCIKCLKGTISCANSFMGSLLLYVSRLKSRKELSDETQKND